MSREFSWFWAVLLLAGSAAPAQSQPPVRLEHRLPPPGIELPEGDRRTLEQELAHLEAHLAEARKKAPPAMQKLLPDVEIFAKAVRYALEHGEFYDLKAVAGARQLLALGDQRAHDLSEGRAPWGEQAGLVVRGYRSAIDDSAQPYGLVIPERLDRNRPAPLYVWLHGRGDKQTDLGFLLDRQRSKGQLAPPDAIVLHPFGRHCNAFKFAGETDVLESVAAVQREYRIDADRVVLAGFSMGGAGTWHLAAHHPNLWVAASPGAGFAETARYQKLDPQAVFPAERTLWGLYDAPHYVRNLFGLPLVAYSGENDPQMQAARVMEEAFAAHGRKLDHRIGPGMGHQYHPEKLEEIRVFLAAAAAQGKDRQPQAVSLQTRTLRYPRVAWVEALELGEHWREARIDAERTAPGKLSVRTQNVAALRLHQSARNGWELDLDGRSLRVPAGDAAYIDCFRAGGGWTLSPRAEAPGVLYKRSGLQGPIDDVWFEPFLVVLPTGKSSRPAVQRWMDVELPFFRDRWRRLFRGDARVKFDVEVRDEDLRRFHVLVWGDPEANKLLARIADRLPIRWTAEAITVGNASFPATSHVLSLIHPNPLAPEKYVVLNSGPTFRPGHDGTNSQQTPKLPDWAVIDLSEPPGPLRSGRIAAADFFDERWQLKPPR